ncbi:YlxR family protein [Acidimicrobium ferrooxidans]|uniref:YlxR family protein n=1 Tax=Acidimicrobium ferrooxidans TaxID=53635 RepID=UPI001494AAF5|nr:YlxR family protein [Acidimicrobium ferrooxidans]
MGCRARRSASDLVRVHVVEGRLAVGAGPGRGAWICPREACLERALAHGRLRRALRLAPSDGELVDEGVRQAWRAAIAGHGASSA